jgi:hypothetical protein
MHWKRNFRGEVAQSTESELKLVRTTSEQGEVGQGSEIIHHRKSEKVGCRRSSGRWQPGSGYQSLRWK